jgi:hypothetical protein
MPHVSNAPMATFHRRRANGVVTAIPALWLLGDSSVFNRECQYWARFVIISTQNLSEEQSSPDKPCVGKRLSDLVSRMLNLGNIS